MLNNNPILHFLSFSLSVLMSEYHNVLPSLLNVLDFLVT